MKTVFLALLAVCSFCSNAAFASLTRGGPPLSDDQIRENVKSCETFLSLPADKKEKFFIRLKAIDPQTAQNLKDSPGCIQFCQNMVSKGVDKLIALEHQYAEWYNHRNDPSSSRPGTESGTCYYSRTCAGASWGHVSNKFQCPSGGGFLRDYNGACEAL